MKRNITPAPTLVLLNKTLHPKELRPTTLTARAERPSAFCIPQQPAFTSLLTS
jgi:hypothetical protein